MFELMDSYSQSSAVIRVIGIGGGGGNAVEHMLANNVEGVEFVCANTDAQALRASSAHSKLQLGNDVTKGLGDPIKYGYHDAVLRQFIEYRRHPADLLQWFVDGQLLQRLGWDDAARFGQYFPDSKSWIEDLEWLDRQLRINYFKRIQAPPIIVLSKRAFGFDLRETQYPGYVPRAYETLKQRVLAMALKAAG
jgi:hypothetical protein